MTTVGQGVPSPFSIRGRRVTTTDSDVFVFLDEHDREIARVPYSEIRSALDPEPDFIGG